jgi:hypothetical protein
MYVCVDVSSFCVQVSGAMLWPRCAIARLAGRNAQSTTPLCAARLLWQEPEQRAQDCVHVPYKVGMNCRA